MNVVRQIRLQAGLTQAELAMKADTSQPTIAAYESGSKSPTLRTLERLADALSIDIVIRAVPSMTREDRRSLALHSAIVKHLEDNPGRTLAIAHRNLAHWHNIGAAGQALRDRWSLWLSLPVEDLLVLMMDTAPFARDMRQVSPFAGVLGTAERTQLILRFQQDEAA